MLESKVADRQRAAAGSCRSGKAADHCIDRPRAGDPCCGIRNWSEDLSLWLILATTDHQLSLELHASLDLRVVLRALASIEHAVVADNAHHPMT